MLQYDAFDIGFITTDDFTNADILEATYPAVAKKLYSAWVRDHAIPVVTGFLGKVIYTLVNLTFVAKNFKCIISIATPLTILLGCCCITCIMISNCRVLNLVKLQLWVGVVVT